MFSISRSFSVFPLPTFTVFILLDRSFDKPLSQLASYSKRCDIFISIGIEIAQI